jgi:hypothetical protein
LDQNSGAVEPAGREGCATGNQAALYPELKTVKTKSHSTGLAEDDDDLADDPQHQFEYRDTVEDNCDQVSTVGEYKRKCRKQLFVDLRQERVAIDNFLYFKNTPAAAAVQSDALSPSVGNNSICPDEPQASKVLQPGRSPAKGNGKVDLYRDWDSEGCPSPLPSPMLGKKANPGMGKGPSGLGLDAILSPEVIQSGLSEVNQGQKIGQIEKDNIGSKTGQVGNRLVAATSAGKTVVSPSLLASVRGQNSTEKGISTTCGADLKNSHGKTDSKLDSSRESPGKVRPETQDPGRKGHANEDRRENPVEKSTEQTGGDSIEVDSVEENMTEVGKTDQGHIVAQNNRRLSMKMGSPVDIIQDMVSSKDSETVLQGRSTITPITTSTGNLTAKVKQNARDRKRKLMPSVHSLMDITPEGPSLVVKHLTFYDVYGSKEKPVTSKKKEKNGVPVRRSAAVTSLASVDPELKTGGDGVASRPRNLRNSKRVIYAEPDSFSDGELGETDMKFPQKSANSCSGKKSIKDVWKEDVYNFSLIDSETPVVGVKQSRVTYSRKKPQPLGRRLFSVMSDDESSDSSLLNLDQSASVQTGRPLAGATMTC